MRQAAKGRALVTGASRGIGKAVAAALAARGWEVIGTCREPRRLAAEDRIQGVRYESLDLSRGKSVTDLARKVGRVDLLVNNAGESPVGPAEELPPAKLQDHFTVNLFSPVLLAQSCLPAMREQGSGTIIFIGSIRGEIATPFSAAYSASKAAVRVFAESMRMEVRAFGVTVCVVSPWHMRTTLRQEMIANPGTPYGEALARVKKNRDQSIAAAPGPQMVARAVLGLLDSPRPAAFTVVGKPLLTFLMRHMPRRLLEAATARTVGLRAR
jgi:NAD(P)-dependent dehydrogenase (short-subunit alcohol dehydrogenase family)